jgi:hypothetical protein
MVNGNETAAGRHFSRGLWANRIEAIRMTSIHRIAGQAFGLSMVRGGHKATSSAWRISQLLR